MIGKSFDVSRQTGFDVGQDKKIGAFMNSISVSTKSELESAKNSGYKEIIVVGELAGQLKKGKSIAIAGAATIGVLITALAAIPFTGGLSIAATAPIAALTGVEITAIIAAAAVGIALIVAVFRDYEEISYEDGKLVLRKRKPE
jgi:hypothetical protein